MLFKFCEIQKCLQMYNLTLGFIIHAKKKWKQIFRLSNLFNIMHA